MFSEHCKTLPIVKSCVMIRTQTAAKDLTHDATAAHNLTCASKLMGWNFTLQINNTPVIISNVPSINTALFFEPEQFWKVDHMSNVIRHV